MKGDFSRDTTALARKLQFTRVLINQGRAISDADVNEQSHIHLGLLRQLIIDVIGRRWRAGANAFAIVAGTRNNFAITAGNFYVDGILCRNDRPCTYDVQPFGEKLDGASAELTKPFVAFLECHERHVTAAQIPALREVALGGPDTSSRAQVVWRVRAGTADWARHEAAQLLDALQIALDDTDDPANTAKIHEAQADVTDIRDKFIAAVEGAPDCVAAQRFFDILAIARPQLVAWAKRDAADTDPCSIAPDSQYRGRENQLYRVEVHSGGLADGQPGGAIFKWSRENGSVVFPIRRIARSNNVLTVALETLGKDRRTGLCIGTWVEFTSDALELSGRTLPLGKVTNIWPAKQSIEVTLEVIDRDTDYSRCTLLRRWDQTDGVDSAGTIPIKESSADDDAGIALERGIHIRFMPGGVYRTGDFWLIPARVASGDIIWSKTDRGTPAAVACDGIEMHRAALAVGAIGAAGWVFTPCGCTREPLCDV
jgi:hypothetical protein